MSSPKRISALKSGRPLMLGHLDEKIKTFLLTLCKKGVVVNTVVAIATAEALIEESDNEHLKLIDLDRCFWAKIIFHSMGFVKRATTTSRPEIPDRARKEAELLFHHEILSKAEKSKISYSMILNIDQIPSKYAPISTRTLAERNSKLVNISRSSNKQAIIAIFGITFTNTFLPMQLIYRGKTSQSFPKFDFPDSFGFSVNPKQFSNTAESLKLLEHIIIPYLNTEREKLTASKEQYALLILDVFSGKMTERVKEKQKIADGKWLSFRPF